MKNYNEKIMEITELGTIPKQLSPEAIEYLRSQIENHMQETGEDDLVTMLPKIINFVYNEAYRGAVNDILDILRGL